MLKFLCDADLFYLDVECVNWTEIRMPFVIKWNILLSEFFFQNVLALVLKSYPSLWAGVLSIIGSDGIRRLVCQWWPTMSGWCYLCIIFALTSAISLAKWTFASWEMISECVDEILVTLYFGLNTYEDGSILGVNMWLNLV